MHSSKRSIIIKIASVAELLLDMFLRNYKPFKLEEQQKNIEFSVIYIGTILQSYYQTRFKTLGKILIIESLKQALLMPNIRIINDFDYLEKTKFNSDIYIKDLEILDTIYNLGNRNVINFNPQLTTIIGGRATGKSMILRS